MMLMLILILFVISVVLITCLLNIQSKSKPNLKSNFKMTIPSGIGRHKVYVKAIWGLANRLRTFRKAYCVCKRTDRDMIIVDGFFDEFCDTHIERLVTFPGVDFVQKNPDNITSISHNKACSYDGKIPEGTIFFDGICDLNPDGFDDADDDTNELYKIMNLTHEVTSVFGDIIKNITNNDTIGLHIRQGSVSDWHYGNFFGNWKDDKLKNPLMEPHFCCFEDKKKNLSSCPGNETVIDRFMQEMDRYPSTTKFFVASDRTGCTMYLHQQYPGRVFINYIKLHDSKPDTFFGFLDWYCLTQCKSLIVSNTSSFSYEASMPKRLNRISL